MIRGRSRRRFLWRSVGLAPIASAGMRLFGMQNNSRTDGRAFRLAKAYDDAGLVAVSPDGGKLCLYFTKHPSESFREGVGWLTRNRRDIGLKVIELGSWREIYSRQLARGPFAGAFASEADLLYVETPLYERRVSEQIVVNWRSGGVLETRNEALEPGGTSSTFRAFDGGVLTGYEFDAKTRNFKDLIRVRVPGWSELARMPYAPADDRSATWHGFAEPSFSASGEYFAHAYGSRLVYRRTSDLAVLWAAAPEQELDIWRIGLSADGSAVAVARGRLHTKLFHIEVLEGRDGSLVTRLPEHGFQGVAISPDRKLLAVGERVELDPKTEDTQMNVKMFETGTGKLIETLVHNRLRVKRGGGDSGSFMVWGIQFTSDGKYLISSGHHTRIWKAG